MLGGGGGGRITWPCICCPGKPWGGSIGGLPTWLPGVKFAIAPLPPGGGGGAGGAPPGGIGLGPLPMGGGGGNDAGSGGGRGLDPAASPCSGGGGGGWEGSVPLAAATDWGLFASGGFNLKYNCNCKLDIWVNMYSQLTDYLFVKPDYKLIQRDSKVCTKIQIDSTCG